VVVDGPFGQSGSADDILEGGSVIALLEKEPGRGVQNQLYGLFRALVPGHIGPSLQIQTNGLYNLNTGGDICQGAGKAGP